METAPASTVLASVVITNFNYGQFLGEAIESALAQTHRPREVVVVDDGSSDNSRDVIAGFGAAITAVMKENGGQDSAINAGFAACRGAFVCFLDADDRLEPGALAGAAAEFERDARVVKVHWRLRVIDGNGRATGALVPGADLPEGELLDALAAFGPGGYTRPPTSGIAWSRRFLEAVVPIPEGPLRSGTADLHLSTLAPLFGRVARLHAPQGAYRVHGANGYWGRTLERLRPAIEAWEAEATILARRLAAQGPAPDVATWRAASWLHRLDRALRELTVCLPPQAPFILVDEDQWAVGEIVAGCRKFPFVERDGVYWGPPTDDAEAIRELQRLQAAGARTLVVAWPAFWWLEHYAGFRQFVAHNFRRVAASDVVIVFDLSR